MLRYSVAMNNNMIETDLHWQHSTTDLRLELVMQGYNRAQLGGSRGKHLMVYSGGSLLVRDSESPFARKFAISSLLFKFTGGAAHCCGFSGRHARGVLVQ